MVRRMRKALLTVLVPISEAFKPRLHTECMLLLLEVVDERFPHPYGRPLLCRPHLGQFSAKPPTVCKVVVEESW